MRKKAPVEIEDVVEPFCGQWRVDMVPLIDAAPEVAEQWSYEKNCGFGPEDFSHGSNVRCWWLCPICEHPWKATICNRVGRGSGCPYCANRKVSEENNLAALFPDLAKEWHPKRNGKLKPAEVVPGSAMKVWWLCPVCAHEWKTALQMRASFKHGCPSCYESRREQSRLLTVEKRGGRRSIPRKDRSKQVLSEDGDISRRWYETERDFVSLQESHPAVARQWHPKKNGKWGPWDFSYGSDAVVWWRCGRGKDHEWQDTISHRTGGRGCPFCAGKQASKTRSLQAKVPRLAREWHPHLNGDLTPADVTIGSGRAVFWLCQNNPDHVWQAKIQSRVDGRNCPFCSNKAVSKDNSLKAQFPYLAAQWHRDKNGNLTPDQVTPGSHKRVWWKCRKGNDHEWQAAVADRTGQGTGCPFCAGRRASAQSSLAAECPDIAAEWHRTKNGKLKPEDLTPGSHKEVWWQCPDFKTHVYKRPVRDRALRQLGCRVCATAPHVEVR